MKNLSATYGTMTSSNMVNTAAAADIPRFAQQAKSVSTNLDNNMEVQHELSKARKAQIPAVVVNVLIAATSAAALAILITKLKRWSEYDNAFWTYISAIILSLLAALQRFFVIPRKVAEARVLDAAEKSSTNASSLSPKAITSFWIFLDAASQFVMAGFLIYLGILAHTHWSGVTMDTNATMHDMKDWATAFIVCTYATAAFAILLGVVLLFHIVRVMREPECNGSTSSNVAASTDAALKA